MGLNNIDEIIKSKEDLSNEVNKLLVKNTSDISIINKQNKQTNLDLVMVVDDDKYQLSSIEKVLKKDYDLLLCSRGESAIDSFKEKAEEITSVILDIRLPDIDGFEVFVQLKKINPDIPIIFITGYQQQYGNGFEVYKTYRPHGYIIKNHENEIAMIKDTLSNAVESYKTRKELDEKKMLEVRNQTMAGLLHDLSNMFMPISLQIESLFELNNLEKIKQIKKNLISYINLFSSNIRILFMYSRGNNIEIFFEKQNLKQIIDNFLDTIKIQIKKDISLEFICNYSGEIYTDKNILCYQVLLNLIKNAQEALYKQENPSITIETHSYDSYKEQYSDKVSFDKAEKQDIIIVVKDNGPGIPEEIIEKLFDPYVSKGKKHGTGLGTWMIKNGVEKLNGVLKLENNPEKGVAYHILFKQ